MDILWHGNAAFTLKGKHATIAVDPYTDFGFKLSSVKADILALGDALGAENGKLVELKEEPKLLDWPGEFEVSGVAIEAFDAARYVSEGKEATQATIFLFVMDGIKICHLSSLGHEITDDLIDRIGDVDVLLLPVGGNPVMDAKTAQIVMDAIEPRVVIPMYFAGGENPLGLKGPEEFLKLVGKANLESTDKWSVSGRSGLPEGVMDFVLLEPKA